LRDAVSFAGPGSLPSRVIDVTRVLVTGMSGTGKSTVLGELRRRGHRVVDTDYDGDERRAA